MSNVSIWVKLVYATIGLIMATLLASALGVSVPAFVVGLFDLLVWLVKTAVSLIVALIGLALVAGGLYLCRWQWRRLLSTHSALVEAFKTRNRSKGSDE